MTNYNNMDVGFSVYVDMKTTSKDDSWKLFGDNLQSELNDIYPKYIDKWVDESLIINCQNQYCCSEFNVSNRKHHCRACGSVFCTKCCNNYIVIPNFIKKPKKSDSYMSWLKNIVSPKTDKELVCITCYNKIMNLNRFDKEIFICEFFDLKTLNIVLKVSKKWYNACIHYLSKFREIQYNRDHTLYCSWESNMLDISRNLLVGHPNWNIHVIKNDFQKYYHGKINKINLENTIENNTKKYSCWKLMCSRKCCLKEDILDFIEILNFVTILDSTKCIFWEDKHLKNTILMIIKNICKQSNDENKIIFKYSIPLLCSTLASFLCDGLEFIDISFIKKMLDEFTIYPDTIYNIFDETEYINSTKDKSMGAINLKHILKEYLFEKITLQKPFENKINKMHTFISNIINRVNKDSQKELHIDLPILYPFDYDWCIIKVNDIKIMKSNSEPLLLDVTIINFKKDIRKVKFLIKKESSLRKEQIVSCVIYLLLFRLKQHESMNNKYNEYIPTYQIKMLSNDIGVIEFVENSITLREVNDLGYTLQNYITDHNKNEIHNSIKKRFLNSLAISCCLSYLLGLGDRHLDNIMINSRGQIFNIDYGYLLENPVTNILGAPNIKVTSEMIDVLGGKNSEYYKEFKIYLMKVYDIMRLYKNIIIDHYCMLGSAKFIDWSIFKDKLETRFMSGLICKDIQIVLMNEIESSDKSYSGWFNDLCHNINIMYNKK